MLLLFPPDSAVKWLTLVASTILLLERTLKSLQVVRSLHE